ncbi:MAG: 2-amino-4-hydroxy-6-hydroxymethyldihydropteridine diphosphokinase [Acidobacteriaceae bacterium]
MRKRVFLSTPALRTAYIALGSNLDDRLANLRAALERIRATGSVVVTACSSVYETEPRDYADQPWFLNAVIAFESDLPPRSLLRMLLEIESALGRQRQADSPAKGPRRIDLDLLLLGNSVVQEADLRVPHPRLQERLFVLAPLVEIAAAELMHPTSHRSILDLYTELAQDPNAGRVRFYGPPLC